MDAVTVEIIRSSTEFVAEEMGIVLRNTAYSPNIRDRMDFSCAILSARGELVAQAEHIPVHLGSMAYGAKRIVEYIEKEGMELEDGDVIVVNDPYIAGTHLNDVTLLKPIFHRGELMGFAANKAHHVDIGGSVPGSIGMRARELLEEGLVIPPTKLVKRGKLDSEILRLISANVRVPKCTIGDLKAQIASLNVGVKRVIELAEKYGRDRVENAWNESMEYTERYTRARIGSIPDCESHAVDYIELGEELINIEARVVIEGDGLRVDFSGTHEQIDAPLNAVFGVTVASTSFALKAVLDPNLPMNFGFLRAVEIHAPEGTIVNPVKPAPVSAGNVETSQRIVDVLLKALAEVFPEKVPAASHGSMNNVVLGGEGWAFYETLGGGSGGRPIGDGVDGVHTNMTNTMNTPVEVVENSYPIMILEYSLREDSGGAGKFRGGLGIRRVYKLLSKAVLSLTAERIKLRPWGLRGGMDGAPGEHYVLKADGSVVRLSGKDTIHLDEGDVVVINTPGGGGYGDPRTRDPRLVLEDVRDGKVSPQSARSVYGVRVVEREFVFEEVRKDGSEGD